MTKYNLDAEGAIISHKDLIIETMTQVPGAFSISIQRNGFVLTTNNTDGSHNLLMLDVSSNGLEIKRVFNFDATISWSMLHVDSYLSDDEAYLFG